MLKVMFIVFAGECYYPAEGWRSAYGFRATLAEARDLADEAVTTGHYHIGIWGQQSHDPELLGVAHGVQTNLGWSHVVDMSTKRIVYEGVDVTEIPCGN